MIGRRIARARRERRLNLREAARLADISASSLARIEADAVSPPFVTISKIAAAFGLDAQALVADGNSTASLGSAGLSSQEAHLVSLFRELDDDHQQLVVQMAAGFAKVSSPPAPIPRAAESEARADPRGARSYLQGWDRRTAYWHLDAGEPLSHTAGGQFSKPAERIEAGDIMWIVFVDEGALHLLGRLVIAGREELRTAHSLRGSTDGVILSRREAERVLNSTNVWPADEHLLARSGTEEALRDQVVRVGIVRRLRFRTSAGLTQVKVSDAGQMSGQAFRSVRQLSQPSAELLERVCEAHGSAEQELDDHWRQLQSAVEELI